MSDIVSEEYVHPISNLFKIMKPLNLMFMITDNGYQVVDNNTDEEYMFDNVLQALELITEYQRHDQERERILKTTS